MVIRACPVYQAWPEVMHLGTLLTRQYTDNWQLELPNRQLLSPLQLSDAFLHSRLHPQQVFLVGTSHEPPGS